METEMRERNLPNYLSGRGAMLPIFPISATSLARIHAQIHAHGGHEALPNAQAKGRDLLRDRVPFHVVRIMPLASCALVLQRHTERDAEMVVLTGGGVMRALEGKISALSTC
jgi:hypothetical protein